MLPASPAFELGNYLRLVTQYRATLMHIAPPVAVALRSTPLLDRTTPEGKAIDLSSVRTMLSGGAPTPVEVIKDIYARTGKMLHIGYGATETGSTSHTAALRPNPSIPDSIEELGSVGEPMSNLEVCIRPNKETTAEQTKALFDDIVAQGELKRRTGQSAPVRPSLAGEVCIRGAAIMLGYYSGLASDEGTGARDAALTSGAMTDDGYYRTGDEGLFDYRGRIWITGRTKELIKVRGFQVPPAELDSLFAKHAEVAEAAATGFVEADGAEQVVMYILPRDQAVLTSDARQRDLVDRLAHFVSDKIARCV